MDSQPIRLSFPYGHELDSFWDETYLCSDACGLEFFKNLVNVGGNYQAKLLVDK